MTAIIAQAIHGRVFIAADSCRGNEKQGTRKTVCKIHRLGPNLLAAQGGASSPTDALLDMLKSSKSEASLDSALAVSTSEGPRLILDSKAEWKARGEEFPTTRLVFCSLNMTSRHGEIHSVDLANGRSECFTKDFCTGSHTEEIMSTCSRHLLPRVHLGGEVPYDRFCFDVIKELEKAYPGSIGLPMDIGRIEFDAAGATHSHIARVATDTQFDRRYRFVFPR